MRNKLKKIDTIQSFSEVINKNLLYIDKTKQIHDLINNVNSVFLKRPRRFGKSMLISTIYELFSGNKELFKDLYIGKNTEYEFEEFPVIHISFANYNTNFNNHLYEYIDKNIIISYQKSNYLLKDFGFQSSKDPLFSLGEIIKEVYKKFNKKVVLLVDEYDKIATTNFHNQQNIQTYIQALSGLYSGIKDANGLGYMKFTLISGLTKVLLTDIFSSLNHLNDISEDYKFYDICGYTKKEIVDNFHTHENDYLSLLAEKEGNTVDIELQNIKNFYNGYNFGVEDDLIYNPYSVNLLFDKQRYDYYWANTGRSQLVIDYLSDIDNYEYLQFIEELKNGEVYVDNSDIFSLKKQEVNLKGILYQAGYLTKIDNKYKIPNRETEFCLIEDFTKITFKYNIVLMDKFIKSGRLFIDGVFNDNKEKLQLSLDNIASILQNINPKWYQNNPEGQLKGYLYNTILLSGLDRHKFMSQEEITNNGYSDITIRDNILNTIVIIEAKGSESITNALKQIREQYVSYYKNLGYKIIIVGLKWDAKKSVVKYELSNEFLNN